MAGGLGLGLTQPPNPNPTLTPRRRARRRRAARHCPRAGGRQTRQSAGGGGTRAPRAARGRSTRSGARGGRVARWCVNPNEVCDGRAGVGRRAGRGRRSRLQLPDAPLGRANPAARRRVLSSIVRGVTAGLPRCLMPPSQRGGPCCGGASGLASFVFSLPDTGNHAALPQTTPSCAPAGGGGLEEGVRGMTEERGGPCS